MSDWLKYWNSKDKNKLLDLLVGDTYNYDPDKRLEKIVENKFYESQNIKKYLDLNKNDIVVDLGSGCGFIANHIADFVNQVKCVDISNDFLEYNKKVNQDKQNIKYVQINFGNFLSVGKFNKLYSTAVFIHFNLYDCFLYLDEIYNNLDDSGKIVFDILNIKHLDINSAKWKRHINGYKKDRNKLFAYLYYHNPTDIINIAEQIGYTVLSHFDENDHTFFILEK